MVKRAPNWQEMIRMNLEVRLVSVSHPTRGRGLPLLFAGETGESGWLERADRITTRRCPSRAMRALTLTSQTLPKTTTTALTGEVPQGSLAKSSKRNQ